MEAGHRSAAAEGRAIGGRNLMQGAEYNREIFGQDWQNAAIVPGVGAGGLSQGRIQLKTPCRKDLWVENWA